MADRRQNPVSPWVVATGVGVAMVGMWMLGREWGESLAEEDSYITNPRNMDVGRRPNPAEAAWLDARQFIMPAAAPLRRDILPHECDPLDLSTWGEGRVCVAAGDVYISVRPHSQHHVKKPGPTQVTFSESLQQYMVGDAWVRGVLRRWLKDAPHQEPDTPQVLLAMQQAGWPQVHFSRTGGARLLRDFAHNHCVRTPVGPIRIVDLPATAGVTAFRNEIAKEIDP